MAHQSAKKKAAPARPGTPQETAKAFRDLEAQIRAVPEARAVTVRTDIPVAVSIALGAAPRIATLEDEIARELPRFDRTNVSSLRTYALAAWYAHLVESPIPAKDTTVQDLIDEATKLRESLLIAAEALAHRALLDPERVTEIRSGSGNVDKANDLVALAALFHAAWPAVEHKTATTHDEIERAAVLGPSLLVALGEHKVPSVASNARLRERAFALFNAAYDECRRAVAYLRWHEGDADSYAPSLFARARKSASPAPTPADVTAPAPAQAATTNAP